jgi:hypothetical protein
MGFAYDVFGTSNTIFRAGYGIYHSQIVDNSFANCALGEPIGVFTYTATPGQVGFPTSIAAAPLPQFPRRWIGAGAQLVRVARTVRISRAMVPYKRAQRVSKRAPQSVLPAVDSKPRAEARA